MLSPPDLDVVRRDRALPGLATVLDPTAMAAVLQRRHPDLCIDDAAITYVRYKPRTSCLVGYRIQLNGASVLLSAHARSPDSSEKLSKLDSKAGVPGPLGPGRFLIPELALAVSVFPNDRRLDRLKRLGDPDKRRSLVRDLVGKRSDILDCELTVLQHRPERRCLARLDDRDGPVAQVKFHGKADYQRARRNAALFFSHAALRVPKLVGCSDRWRAVAVEWLAGEMLEPSAAGAGLVGVALAELHAQTVDPLTSFTRDAQARALRTLVRDLAFLAPSLGRRRRELARRLCAALVEESGPLKPIHGDFYSGQVVMCGDQIGLIDFDEATLGSPAWDLGNFIARLRYRSLLGDLSEGDVDTIAAAFTDGYRVGGGDASSREVRLQTAVGLMRLATAPFRTRDPVWLDRLEAVLDATELLLAASPARSAGGVFAGRDLAMPFLERALDPDGVNDGFNLATVGAGDWRVESTRLVRHKPARRCLIEYNLSDGDGRAAVLLGKMRARSVDQRSYDLQRRLWETSFGPAAPDRIMVAEPIALAPEFSLWLQRKVAGRPVSELLSPPDLPDPGRIAAATAKLHQSGVVAARRHGMAEELRILDERLGALMQTRPEWTSRLDAVLTSSVALARRAVRAQPRGIHRDFHPGNVLVDDDGLHIIDLDLYSSGDGAVDVGNFLGHIIEHGLRCCGDENYLPEWRLSFEQTYCGLVGDVSPINIRIYELLTLVRLIEISARMPERRPFTESLLTLCEARLEAELVLQRLHS